MSGKILKIVVDGIEHDIDDDTDIAAIFVRDDLKMKGKVFEAFIIKDGVEYQVLGRIISTIKQVKND